MGNIILNTLREGYGIDQIDSTMTVGELIRFLSDFDEDRKIYLSFDNGYTFGGITEGQFEEVDQLPKDFKEWTKSVLKEIENLTSVSQLCSERAEHLNHLKIAYQLTDYCKTASEYLSRIEEYDPADSFSVQAWEAFNAPDMEELMNNLREIAEREE